METAERSAGDLRKSCDLCCSRKRRCDGDGVNPCTLCTQKNASCTYSKKGRRGPKPKPKRNRDPGHGMMGISRDGVGGFPGDGDPMDWAGDATSSSQKTPRIADIVRLSPSRATGMLGLKENQHLNSFFSGFGACTQIVQEDEIRGAMIHILSEGQFGMPDVEGESFYSTSSSSASSSGEKTETVISGPTDLPMIHLAGGGLAIPAGEPLEGARGSDEELRQRAQRARLSAGVACLWAGIGVGAMLCGDTAEATLHYAENAREAIKGCYDVVSEEVLRAFLCLAHMHSFREDFQKFFRYTAMANDVAASLDRQGKEAALEASLSEGGYRGPQPKGCSEPARFLLKCFDALSHFLELEGEEIDTHIEDLQRSTSSSTSGSSESMGNNSQSRSPSITPGNSGAATAQADYAGGCSNDNSRQNNGDKKARTTLAIYGGGADAMAVVEAAKGVDGEKENEPGMSFDDPRVGMAMELRSHPGALEKENLPGYRSAVRIQKCISALSDNPVTQQLGDLSPSNRGSSNGNLHRHQRLSSSSSSSFGEDKEQQRSNLVNQVLFVGDTRILEVSMSVDCSCIRVMCMAVSGADWADVATEARLVANTADAILVPVLASPSISRSVCAVKLLADSAFSHLCLGNADDALRAVRRFCSILKEFPGIMRFPPWRHCFHWMSGMLESAGLRDEYNTLRNGLMKINMKGMRSLPEFGNAAHDVMCKCPHFRCQATHRALYEHAKRDPFGSFHVPNHCPQYSTAARAASERSCLTFKPDSEPSPWVDPLGTAASGSSSSSNGNSSKNDTSVGVNMVATSNDSKQHVDVSAKAATSMTAPPPVTSSAVVTSPMPTTSTMHTTSAVHSTSAMHTTSAVHSTSAMHTTSAVHTTSSMPVASSSTPMTPSMSVTSSTTPITPLVSMSPSMSMARLSKPATVLPTVTLKPRSRVGASTASTAKEARAAAMRRRKEGSMPTSEPASQQVATLVSATAPSPAPSPLATSRPMLRRRTARVPSGATATRFNGILRRVSVSGKDVAVGVGKGIRKGSTSEAQDRVSNGSSGVAHAGQVEDNPWRALGGVSDDHQRPCGPPPGGSFEIFAAAIQDTTPETGLKRAPSFSVGGGGSTVDTPVTCDNGSVTASVVASRAVAAHGQNGGQQASSRASSVEADDLTAINSVFGSGGAPASTPSITSVSRGPWSRNDSISRTSSSGGVPYDPSNTGQSMSNFPSQFVGSGGTTSSSSPGGRMELAGGRTVYGASGPSGRGGGSRNGVAGGHNFVGAVGRNATSSQMVPASVGGGSNMPSPGVMGVAGGAALNPSFSSSLCLPGNSPPGVATGLGIGNSPGFATPNDIMDGLGLANNNNGGFSNGGSALFIEGSMSVAPGDVGGHGTGDAGASEFTGNPKSDGFWEGLYEVHGDMEMAIPAQGPTDLEVFRDLDRILSADESKT